MAVKLFAAIDVGSFELGMKIFEISKKNGVKEIDHIRHRIDLGTDTFDNGKLGYESIDELCRVLREFAGIMKSYRITEYKAYGTSAVRDARNRTIILEQIRLRAGLEIEVLSNSEQRFLDYKAIALKESDFDRIISEGAAIVDIGGGSIQISLFDKNALVTTQNLKLGVLRLFDSIRHLRPKNSRIDELLSEMIDNQLAVFKKLYLKDTAIKHIIVVDDYLSAILRKRPDRAYAPGHIDVPGHIDAPGYIDAAGFDRFMESIQSRTNEQIAGYLGVAEEYAPLLYISGVLARQVMSICGAEMFWAPGVTLCDGIAYEYAEKHKLIPSTHNFEQDIIACARNISKRYMGSRRRSDTLEAIALTIYDSMKKIHGLGKRERLLLQIATRLHDCGKYISLTNLGECSYSIIMATEIIGLSHTEREIVANVVKYNHMEIAYYREMRSISGLDEAAYLTIAKLTAILRIANALDRSHKQKFRNIKAVLHEEELFLSVDTEMDITYERGVFRKKAEYFEEVFSIRPVIRQK